MVAASKTFSGDLSTSLTSAIADLVLAAATSGGSKKAQALQLAKQYGVDPMLSKGEFFAQGLAEGATSGLPSFMRYRSPEINESYLARGQSSSDPLMGLPAHLRNLPEYQQLANPLEQKFKVATGRTPYSPLTKQLSGVTGISPDRAASGQGVKVHDEKLGQFLAAVALSLSSSLDSVRKRLNETEEAVITVKDGVLNLHKQLEISNDVVENKLDQIIDALRNQNILQKLRDDKEEATTTSEQQAKKDENWSTQVAQKVGEDEKEFQDRFQQEEMEDFYERIASQQDDGDDLPRNEGEDGSGFRDGGIASGPDSGYWAKLHGDELITPLDNNATQGQPLASETPINMNFPKGDNSNNMSPRITNINRSGGKSAMSMVDRSKNIIKAMELPFKTTGIALMHMLGKSVTGNPIFGQQAPSIKTIAEPVASAFGVSNSITNNVMKTASSQEHENKRREETQGYTTKTEKPWWQSITDLFKRDEPLAEPEEDDENKEDTGDISSKVNGDTNIVAPRNDTITKSSTTNKNWFEGAKNWWNRGRNVSVKGENTANWFGKDGLLDNDWKQRGKFGKGGKLGGWDFTRGFRPGVSANEGGIGSGPTPAVRQSVERPLNAIKSLGAAKGGFIGLILNELMNPASLADGTLEGNKDVLDLSSTESNSVETNNLVLEKSRELNNSSKENIFTKMENNTSTSTEPIVINNQQEVNDDLGSEDPSYVSQVGDPGFDDFYPSPY